MKIIECPRDAMQGLDEFIPTNEKINYINQLLKVGFDTIDFGSFVSSKAVPQMRDTIDVLTKLNWSESNTNLLAIVANTRGAQEASTCEGITYLGFPLSISETFQVRNTNKSIAEALNTLEEIKNICLSRNKKLVTYISMGFGNPYHDRYEPELVNNFIDILITLGSDVISIADTVGLATAIQIKSLFTTLTEQYPATELGVHLHSNPMMAWEKIDAAYQAGCRRLDGAIKGYGGCPMATDDLVGNLPTEVILDYMTTQGLPNGINELEFQKAMVLADKIFPKH
jgi:hydroxymethylglutaryl-CoA lyase